MFWLYHPALLIGDPRFMLESKLDNHPDNTETTFPTFIWPVRVYYEDTDAGGIVYHARYLHFLERARTEWLRLIGFDQSNLAESEHNIVFVVRDMSLKFIRPARLDDQLTVSVEIVSIKRASLVMQQYIYDGQHKKLLAQVTVACLDAQNFKPIALPESIRWAIHENRME